MASHLLVVETSPRGPKSISRHLTRRFVDAWKAAHPHGQVTMRDLAAMSLPYVEASWLEAYFTPDDQQSSDMKERLRLSDVLVSELLAADHVVIGTPVYNYNVPAALKSWIDHIVRKGKTLGFDGKGLIPGKRATVLLASGGVYTEGSPIRDRDIATQYLRLIFRVLGITDIDFIAGGGAKAVDMGETTMTEFLGRFDEQLGLAAAL